MEKAESFGRVAHFSRTVLNRVAAALLPIIVELTRARLAVADEAPVLRPAAAWSPLMTRQPLGFDRQTFEYVASAVRNLPAELPNLIEFARHQHQVLGRGGALILLLAIAIGCGIYGRVQLARRFKLAFAPLSQRISAVGQEWLAALCDLVAATLLPTLLLGLWGL